MATKTANKTQDETNEFYYDCVKNPLGLKKADLDDIRASGESLETHHQASGFAKTTEKAEKKVLAVAERTPTE